MMKKKKTTLLLKNEKSDFFVCKTVNEQKKISCYLLWPLFEIKLADKYNDDEYD